MNKTIGLQAKDMLNDFLKDAVNRACASTIFQLLTGQHTSGDLSKIRREVERDSRKIYKGVDFLKNTALENREFSASIIPTTISSGSARNFLFTNEKEPTESEIYYWLYLLLSGLYSGTYVINLINVNENAKEDFRKGLVSARVMFTDRRGVDRGKLAEVCRGPIPRGEHAFAFAFLNYFMHWHKNQMRARLAQKDWKERLIEWELSKSIADWGITDETTLIVCDIPREKRKMYYIPKIKDFIYKWYLDFFFDQKLDYPPLGMFVSSLYVSDRNYRDISATLLNKFLYCLLQGSINGDVLEKLVLLKADYMLSAKKKMGILYAKNFYSKLAMIKS